MNAFDIEKTKDGYIIKIKAGRGTFATALINGELKLAVGKDLAARISKSLYTPKKPLVEAADRAGYTDNAFPKVTLAGTVDVVSTKKAAAKRKPRQKKDI